MASLRRYVNQLGERENIDQVFLVADKQLRANRNGNLYLQLRLTDKTGSLTGMLWNANDNVFNSVETGNYLRVAGTTQVYNGQLQMIVTRIEPTDPRQIDEQDFITVSSEEIDQLAKRLTELLRAVKNVHLRNLAECFLADEEFMGKFTDRAGGNQEPSCLSRRPVGPRRQPDGSLPRCRAALSRARCRSVASSERFCTTRAKSTS